MPPDGMNADTLHAPSGRLGTFTASLLRHEGALVDPIEPDGLEVLAPPEVQQILGVGELARLGFGSTLPPAATRVGLEGDWLDRFGRLLGAKGRWSRCTIAPAFRPPGDPERLLGHELVLDNATYRLVGAEPAWTRYLAMDFRASAVSDDKRDFVLRLGLNLATGAMPDAVMAAVDSLQFNDEVVAAPPGDAILPAIWERQRLLDVIAQALPARMDQVLGPFVTGMQRRLARDQDRLHEYHNELHRAAMARAVALPDGDAKRQREEQRAAAIAREYTAKLDDLARQYATRVRVEWVQTLELVMPVHRLAIQVRRRKADRIVHLDWNPLSRRLEPPVCEATLSADRPRLVCDDALHLVVPPALGPCAGCGKAYCRACHPSGCPKCGATAKRQHALRFDVTTV